MMHMNGLTSLQYYAGLFLSDIVMYTGPAVIISIALIFFEDIMVRSVIFDFFISFVFFGMAQIQLCYLFSHIFDDPETGGKYIALIFTLGLFFGPIAVSLIFAAIFGFDSSIGNALAPWYFIDPTLTFVIQLYGLCCHGKPNLDDLSIKLFGTIETTTGLYIGVILYQIVIYAALNIFIDMWIRSGYKKQDGRQG